MVTHDVEEAVFCSQRVLVLASDPGRIAEEMPVDLPASRDLTVKRSARFLELRARAEDLVRAQHRAHVSLTDPEPAAGAIPEFGAPEPPRFLLAPDRSSRPIHEDALRARSRR
jgi:hypothetical protein